MHCKVYVYHVTDGKGQTVLSALERGEALDSEEAKSRYSPGTITKPAE